MNCLQIYGGENDIAVSIKSMIGLPPHKITRL